jgi:hypothetical protein
MITHLICGLTLAVGQTSLPAAPVPAYDQVQAVPVYGSGVSAPPALGTLPPGTTSVVPDEKPGAQPPKNADKNDEPKKDEKNGEKKEEPKEEVHGIFHVFVKTYWDAFFPDSYCHEKKYGKKESGNSEAPAEEEEKPRRAMPSPWGSPFPVTEYQGYPIVGVPPGNQVWPLQKALMECESLKDFHEWSKINMYGWVTASGNWSTAKQSNSPTSYWLVPNHYELDQAVLRFERELDSVQQDHIDWGFRSSYLYGIDYRYMTAGGWFSEQLLLHNRLNGFDPTEQYVDIYFPHIADGMILRIGRWIACPDIETQFAPDNYLGTHSILFTFDTYTQTGFMFTFKLNDQWIVQAGMNAGNDMAPWYKGAIPCGYAGVRWVSQDNNDAMYTVLNQINNAEFRHFDENGQPSGHDNFNYIVSTWEHRFNRYFHTKTEGYFMWQRNAELGGTPTLGQPQFFAPSTGDNPTLPGLSLTYGFVNYTALALTKKDYITLRNEWWRDERGMRSGTPGTYTSHTIGISHNFNDYLQVRPEIGYYSNWTNPAFDNGTRNGIWLYGFDVTLRF